jgi:hypothetical protein
MNTLQFLEKITLKYGDLRCSIFLGVSVFLILITFATPKEYLIYASGGGGKSLSTTCISPIFSETPSKMGKYDIGYGGMVVFKGLSTSVLAGELLLSISAGLLCWIWASWVCRKHNAIQQLTSQTDSSQKQNISPQNIIPFCVVLPCVSCRSD